MLYRVRWQGYRASADTWEPIEHFEDRAVVDEYLRALPRDNAEPVGHALDGLQGPTPPCSDVLVGKVESCDVLANNTNEASISNICDADDLAREQSEYKMSPAASAEDTPMAAYEMARLERIQQNQAKLAALGLGMAPLILPSTPSKRNHKNTGVVSIVCRGDDKTCLESDLRRSFRLAAEQRTYKVQGTESSRGPSRSLARQSTPPALRSKSFAKVSRAHKEDQLLLCRSCHKSFLSPLGLYYHQAHRVCLKQAQFVLDSVHDSARTPSEGSGTGLSCHACWKHFLSELGLRYHVQHNVCQRYVSMANASWFRRTSSADAPIKV
jgi:hypothetical protein